MNEVAIDDYVVYKATAPLGTPVVTISGSAVAQNTSAAACPNINTAYVLAVLNDSVNWIDSGMDYGRKVEYDLETWPTSSSPLGNPPSFPSGAFIKITEHLSNPMRNGLTSDNGGQTSGQFVDILGNTSAVNAGVYVADRSFTVMAGSQNLGHVLTLDRVGKHCLDHIEIHLSDKFTILNNYKDKNGKPLRLDL